VAPDGYGIIGTDGVDTGATSPRSDDGPGTARYRVHVRDLMLSMSIGIHPHEHGVPQRVRVNVTLDLTWPEDGFGADDTQNVFCYEKLIGRIEEMAAAGHVRLCETFAERIADGALESGMVDGVRVTVEKLDIMPNATVGAEIEKRR
jgi:dihydroneopterin aldolase